MKTTSATAKSNKYIEDNMETIKSEIKIRIKKRNANMIKTPKQLIEDQFCKDDNFEPITLTLEVEEMASLMVKYHKQFTNSNLKKHRAVNEKHRRRLKEHAKAVYDYANKI